MKALLPRTTGIALVLAAAAAVPASAAEKTSLGYVLPKTLINVEVAQTLAACPEKADELPEIETAWTIIPAATADPTMRFEVDTSSGFLAKRSTALVLRADGTPEVFNASASGQGAAVVTSLVKLATTLAPLAMAAPLPNGAPAASTTLSCKPAVLKAITAYGKLGEEIGTLEDRILLGTATAAERQLVERKRKKRAAIREALTLSGGGAIDPPAWDGAGAGAPATQNYIEPLAYDQWFSNLASADFPEDAVPGVNGFRVDVEPAPDAKALRSGAAAPKPGTMARALFYRQPLPGTVVAAPCATARAKDGSCTAAKRGDAVSEPVAAVFGQWAGVRSLPVGSGGLFGSREAKAKFDPFGTPVELSYGSDSGSAGIASSLDAASGAVTDIRDAKLAEIERAIKLEEARQKLAELRAPSDE
jgi:hypothetical protein